MISVIGCETFSSKGNDLKFDLIQPTDEDLNVISDSLVDQILKHNCKLQPDNEACDVN